MKFQVDFIKRTSLFCSIALVSLLLGFLVSACTVTGPASTPDQADPVLYFYFASTSCPNCVTMAGDVQRFYDENDIEAYGVPIYPTGSLVEAFQSKTGLTVPIDQDPGLDVDTSHHPILVLYDKQTQEYRVAAVGAISYQDLVSQYEDFSQNKPITQMSGPT